MATPSEEMKQQKLTFRKFKDGEHEWHDLQEQIFQSSWSHKCPTYVHRTPPCQGSCPSGEDIRGWLDIVRGIEKPPKGITWQEYAFRRSTDANPFPSVMGRVCPAPCEDGCNRNEVEDHVGINAVEQFIGDTAFKNGFDFKFRMPEQETGRKVAIIGGGPAGLAAAYQLRRRGHGATIFDDHAELGGFMRYGIPGYRTPRDVLDNEIKRILDLGVEVRTHTRVGRDVSLEELESQYDAVLWCIGTHTGRGLPVPGWENTPNCVSGIAFLSAFNQGRLQVVTGNVVVVGGGDTSIDVASVARRLGHIKTIHEKDRPENVVWGHTAHDVASTAAREGAQVTLTSLFPVDKMTAAEREVQDALREGVTILGSVMPIEVVKDASGRAIALRMAKCEVEKGVPKAIPGTEFEIEAELIVSAIGQKGDMTGLEAMDNGRGFIDSDAHFQVKGKKGHFVAGDIVRPHLLTTAIGQASIAVESIDHYFKNQDLGKRPKVDKHHFDLLGKLREAGLEPESYHQQQTWGTSSAKFAVHNYEDRAAHEIIPADKLFLGHFQFTPRLKRDEIHIHGNEVIGNFQERIVALTDQQAVAEAKRCMSCGMCFECDNCVIFCPQEAVKRTPKDQSTTGRYVYTDYTRCIGCHICADVCPTGYIDMGMGE
jgi:NADPH-dependent glutamate synthase beta subunit-like oxidoreductase